MEKEFINLTPENLCDEHVCCIIRKNAHSGIDAKKKWLSERLKEGHIFRKLNVNACVFIEYAPLETAKNLPCVFNNFAVFFNGEFVTVNQIDGATAEKIIKKHSTSKHQISGK